jgi:transposase
MGLFDIIFPMKFSTKSIPESNKSLREQYVALAQENLSLEQKIERLEAELRLFRKKAFQTRSEKFPSGQGDMFQDHLDELAKELDQKHDSKKINVPAHKRVQRKSRRLDPNLERVIREHDLDEDQKKCSCGKQKKVIGVETVEQLGIEPQKTYIIEHRRKKYACNCGCAPVRAPMPKQPIPKSQFSPILLAWCVVSKYVDGLPLYRLSKILKRCGMKICHKTMARALVQASHHLRRLTEYWPQVMDGYDIRQCDETALQVLREPGRAATTKSWLWIQKGGPPGKPIILVNYSPTRAGDVAKSLFENFRDGYLVVDGYGGYKAVATQNNLRIVNCMDHSRRKFDEAWKALSPKQQKIHGGIAKEALERFKVIYAIEAVGKILTPGERRQLRQEKSLPLLHDFKLWLELIKENSILSEKTRTAINYFLNNFPELCSYCEDGRLPISNIATEHCAKQIALARKAFLFACTPSGADATAVYFSVVMTAQANGLNPFDYITFLYTKLPNIKPGESLESLQPWSVTQETLDEFMKTIPRPSR